MVTWLSSPTSIATRAVVAPSATRDEISSIDAESSSVAAETDSTLARASCAAAATVWLFCSTRWDEFAMPSACSAILVVSTDTCSTARPASVSTVRAMLRNASIRCSSDISRIRSCSDLSVCASAPLWRNTSSA